MDIYRYVDGYRDIDIDTLDIDYTDTETDTDLCGKGCK